MDNIIRYLAVLLLSIYAAVGFGQSVSTDSYISMDSVKVNLTEIEIESNFSIQDGANSFLKASNYYLPIKEASKWAGGRNDISRMISNFAGNQVNSDEDNGISIRGNSPIGNLWRLNGMPISNPNHFSTFGSSGGPVLALNPNVLSGVDFLTGAFPAEYGNATSGIFDLIMRKGSYSKHKQMLQVSAFSGAEVLAEGPIKLEKSSYLIAARKSFLDIAKNLGLITDVVPDYYDINFNLSFKPNNRNQISLFGFAGGSNLKYSISDDGSDTFTSQLINLGLQHFYTPNDKLYFKTTIGISHGKNIFQNEDIVPKNNYYYFYDQNTVEQLISINSFLNYKIFSNSTLRVGVSGQINTLNLESYFTRDDTQENFLETDFSGNYISSQSYISVNSKLKEGVELQAGIHFSKSFLNHEFLIEPRLYLGKNLGDQQTISFSYGKHNQIQPANVLFFNNRKIAGDSIYTNKRLKNTKSHHLVLGYKLDNPNQDFSMNLNAFYQHHFDIPIDSLAPSYSLINYGQDIERDQRPSLYNAGTANNVGIEFTVSKKLKNWTSLASITLLDATYKASDRINRNSAYNFGHILNILVGRKIKLNSKLELSIDSKINWAGGLYYTPINPTSSFKQERTIRDYNFENKLKRPNFFKADIRFGMELPAKQKLSQSVYIEFQNVTNRSNPIRDYYSLERDRIEMINNLGFFFDFIYRITF